MDASEYLEKISSDDRSCIRVNLMKYNLLRLVCSIMDVFAEHKIIEHKKEIKKLKEELEDAKNSYHYIDKCYQELTDVNHKNQLKVSGMWEKICGLESKHVHLAYIKGRSFSKNMIPHLEKLKNECKKIKNK